MYSGSAPRREGVLHRGGKALRVLNLGISRFAPCSGLSNTGGKVTKLLFQRRLSAARNVPDTEVRKIFPTPMPRIHTLLPPFPPTSSLQFTFLCRILRDITYNKSHGSSALGK
jgi:hypothetical protein